MSANDTVCFCKNVTVQDIKDAIDNGATNYKEVIEATKATTGCGRCKDTIKEVVNDLLQ